MIKKIAFYIIVVFLCQYSLAQNQSLTVFEASLDSLPEEEVWTRFDEFLLNLELESAPDSTIFNTLDLKLSFARKFNHPLMGGFAVLSMLDYPEFLDKKTLFQYIKFAGSFQARQGKQDEAVILLLDAKTLAEELNNDTLKTNINKELGIQFSRWNNFDLAKKYLFESLQIAEKMNYDRGIAGVCMTIGNIYKNTDSYDTAKFYYDKSIEHSKSCDWTRGLAGNYNNLGNLYLRQELYDKAIEYYQLAIPINEAANSNGYLATNFENLGGAYSDLGKNDEALYYFNKAIALKSENQDSSSLAQSFLRRSKVYASKKSYRRAYKDLRLGTDINKKFTNSSVLALAAAAEANFNNEKKEANIKQLRAEQKARKVLIAARNEELLLEAALQKDTEYILWGFGVVLLGLLGVIFAFWRNAQQRKNYTKALYSKNAEIETVNTSLTTAKKVLTVKNEEILDSITYAKRIQAAILPSEKHLQQSLEDSFVLYLPKDIVAGDFYWTEQIGDTVLFAVADCTGHGVPGAMVSVICNNALNEIIKLKAVSDPGLILDLTTDHILKQFDKSEEDVKDGMDIGLCAYNAKTHKLQYAGANIPLWIVRQGEVIEIKATRQPVGKHVLRQKFTTNDIEIFDGDIMYMSSDGFADQFGGQRNKKFMKKNFKNLILEIAEKPLEEQNTIIKATFSDWKSTNEQVDDICVMGVKFKAS